MCNVYVTQSLSPTVRLHIHHGCNRCNGPAVLLSWRRRAETHRHQNGLPHVRTPQSRWAVHRCVFVLQSLPVNPIDLHCVVVRRVCLPLCFAFRVCQSNRTVLCGGTPGVSALRSLSVNPIELHCVVIRRVVFALQSLPATSHVGSVLLF